MIAITLIFLCCTISLQALPEERTVLLFGDSLIGRPWREHNLEGYLKENVITPESIQINYVYSANNGERIASLNERIQQTIADTQPWAVILFWDSDCSDVNENELTEQQVEQLRFEFQTNLFQCIQQTQQSGSLLAVAGPGILGEGPVGKPKRFQNKEQMLKDYKIIIQSTAQALNVPYIDIRQAFLDAIPSYWIYNSGQVTKDGEHPNEKGTEIEAKHFAIQINEWLSETGNIKEIRN